MGKILEDRLFVLTEDELDRALIDVLDRDDWRATWAVCREIEHRGNLVTI